MLARRVDGLPQKEKISRGKRKTSSRGKGNLRARERTPSTPPVKEGLRKSHALLSTMNLQGEKKRGDLLRTAKGLYVSEGNEGACAQGATGRLQKGERKSSTQIRTIAPPAGKENG